MVSIHRVPAIVYLIIREICFIFRFKRGTFSVFLSQGVWRNLTNRITKSPRLYSVSIFAITLVGFFSRQTLG